MPGLKASRIVPGVPPVAACPVLRLIGISCSPFGTRNSTGGLSASACFTNSVKIGRRDLAAGRAAAHRLRIVETDEDADRQIRREAHEPGILLVVGGAGLAGDRTADRAHDVAVPRWTTPSIMEVIW
jgi:hypothetical protein